MRDIELPFVISATEDLGVSHFRSKPVMCIEIEERYVNVSEAVRKTNIKHISAACRGERKTASGYSWTFI